MYNYGPTAARLDAEFVARLQISPADRPPTVLEHHLLTSHPSTARRCTTTR